MDIELLKQRLSYDPETGVFTWVWHRERRYIGAKAGRPNVRHGYVEIKVAGARYRAGRLAWVMAGREIPAGAEIDHINNNNQDDRLANLRLANRQGNSANRRRQKNNTTGFKGVSLHKGKYQASIRVNDQLRYLGRYNTPEAAHAAYVRAAQQVFAEFAHAG